MGVVSDLEWIFAILFYILTKFEGKDNNFN